MYSSLYKNCVVKIFCRILDNEISNLKEQNSKYIPLVFSFPFFYSLRLIKLKINKSIFSQRVLQQSIVNWYLVIKKNSIQNIFYILLFMKYSNVYIPKYNCFELNIFVYFILNIEVNLRVFLTFYKIYGLLQPICISITVI